jgi:hypothetical protein
LSGLGSSIYKQLSRRYEPAKRGMTNEEAETPSAEFRKLRSCHCGPKISWWTR